MFQVGIRDLKAHLSEYLHEVRQGHVITITDRHHAIASLSPVRKKSSFLTRFKRLKEEGVITGNARKPQGLKSPVVLRKSQRLSDAILEDRS